MKATDTNLKTWTPAVQRRAPDNIVSSNYTTAKVFVPSYEKEVRPRIEQLLTNDYQRIWWKEKRVWDETIAEKTAGKRILPRMLIKRKVPTCVTVKYQTRTDRWMGKKKQDFVLQKSNPKKKEIKQESNRNSNTEELKSAEDNDTKVEKNEETKSEDHKEIQPKNEKETKYEREEEKKEESRTD